MHARRRFLRSFAGAAAAAALPAGRAPALVTSERTRPQIPFGVAVGDVAAGRAVVWSRADRPARLLVEYSTSESFAGATRLVGPAALPEDDFTARLELAGLPPGRDVFYRVLFQDLSDLRTSSAPATGRFRTPPVRGGGLTLAWSADTVGQGWGIDSARGGLKTYDAMRRLRPDVFVHVGDTIYADNPLVEERRLDDGSVWRNLVTPAKAKVAETLEEFRGNYQYNLLDENVRRFNAEVSQVVLWDDHEVRNNWYPTQVLEDPRYREKSVALLAARGKRAFLEYTPGRWGRADADRIYRSLPQGPSLEVFAIDMRSYRGPNSPNRQVVPGEDTALLGTTQLEWLKARLRATSATWKLIASDMPLGLSIPDGEAAFEAVANGDDGPPGGRELEIAELLGFIHSERIENVVWLTGDVHYAAAHHYDPERARFREFTPFWEFVAGPLHAGTFGPTPLDGTFGPELRFLSIPDGMKPNRPPSDGLQFFGTIGLDGGSEVLTVRLHDATGRVLYSNELTPRRP